MNEFRNNFLYTLLKNYFDIDDILNECKSSGNLYITNDKVIGHYFNKEQKKIINITIDDKLLTGKIIFGNVIQIFTSQENDKNYKTSFIESNLIENNSKNYSMKMTTKQIIYDKNKVFLKYLEKIEYDLKTNINGALLPINNLCSFEKNTIIKVNDKLIKIHEEVNKKGDYKQEYSFSDNYKPGVFLSEGIVLDDFYLAFENINKEKVKKMLKDNN